MATIKAGSTVAIGGVHFHNSPMSLVREIVRQEIGELTVVGGFSLGIQIDMLVGAGLVSKVICPYVGLEHFGLAPNYRRAVEEGTLDIVECDEGLTMYGLRAAAEALPFHPYPEGVLEGTDLPTKEPEWYQQVQNPFDGSTYYVVPPIRPDVALLHTQMADTAGNGVAMGATAADALMATASHRVLLTCDETVPNEWVQQEHQKTYLLAHWVDHVVETYHPAHPCSSHGMYRYDSQHLEEYTKAAVEGGEAFTTYLDTYVRQPTSQWNYLQKVGGKRKLAQLRLEGRY